MYYDLNILNKGGKYSFIWYASIHAKSDKKLNKRAISSVSIAASCDDLQKIVATSSSRKKERFSLYLSSQLMYGIVIIYKKAVGFACEEIHLIIQDKKRTRDRRDDDSVEDVRPNPKRPRRSRVTGTGVIEITVDPPRADTHQIDIAPPTPQDIANITLREETRPAALPQGEIAPNDLLDIPLPAVPLEYSDFRPDRSHAIESSRILELGGREIDITIAPAGSSHVENLPEIVVNEPVDLPANRTLVVSELDSLESVDIQTRRGRSKKPKKLIIDRKTKIRIISSSDDPEYTKIWCIDLEDWKLQQKKIKKIPDSLLLNRPVTRYIGDRLRSRFAHGCQTRNVPSAENDILQLILGRPLSQPDQQLGAHRGSEPPTSALLGSVNLPDRLETSLPPAPGSKQTLNIPPMESVTDEMNQIAPVLLPDNIPEDLETPAIRPEPEILRSEQTEREQIQPDDMRMKWKASKVLEKLKVLWSRKVHPITMISLCNPDVNTNLDAASCFRTLLDLYASRHIRVSRSPGSSEIMNIMQGEKLLRPRVLRLEESPPQ